MQAMTYEEGLSQVRELVGRFKRNLSHYRSTDFDETSTREQFINPLFEALGWDVLDHAGLGSNRDVIFHSRLVAQHQVAGLEAWDEDLSTDELAAREPTVRIPDYAFRHDGRVQFFVEAKKPSTSIRRRGPAFQVKSYAWSQQIPFAVLTDFQELRVFNCTARPDYDAPEAGLLEGFSLNFQEYESAWPRLWETLSMQAVSAGTLERLRMPSAPRGAIPVDESFLRDLDQWRNLLARDILTRNPDLTSWQLAEATQRILDRLVFLRVCEDRGIEEEFSLRRFSRVTDAYHAMLPQFRRLDSIYNGALFADHFAERLEVGDGVFQRLIAGLYFPAPYRFDAIGVDLLGAIYERFLSKEVDTNSQSLFVDKPEIRHGGGVYYTPRWVVDRVVAKTLDPLLETCRTPRAVANLRILDPACGSGSFLLGALDHLIAWHEHYFTEHPDESPDSHYRGTLGREHLTTDFKAQIVTNCLYGVDIDPQAVEVAQMSIYLKILEEENSSTLARQPRLFHAALLPDLRHNIRSGNSLLDTSQISGSLLYDEAMRRRINPFDWRDDVYGFGRIFTETGGFHAIIGNPPYARVQVLRHDRPEECAAYAEQYRSGSIGSFDIASLFVERSLTLLRAGRTRDRDGRLGFIISRQFAETDAGQPLRQLLADGKHVDEIVDFGTGLVFDPVSAYTLLLHLTHSPNSEYTLTRVLPPPSMAALDESEKPESIFTARLPSGTLGEASWDLALPRESALLARLATEHPTLKDVSGNSIFQGVVTGADGIFRALDVGPDPAYSGRRRVQSAVDNEGGVSLSLEQEWLRPIYAGKTDFRRFHVWPSREWLILPYTRQNPGALYQLMSPAALEREAPQVFDWLSQNRQRLEGRSGEWNDSNWFSYSRRQNLEKFSLPKILVPYMLDELCAAYDADGHYFVNVTTGGYGIQVARSDVDPLYLAALLNSSLLSWVLRRYSRAFRGGWFAARKGNLVRIPIAVPAQVMQEEIVAAYKHCCRLASEVYDENRRVRDDEDSRLLQRLFAAAVREFDQAVFELYGLSADEVRLIRSLPPEEDPNEAE